ncbi:efflux RND transporter permease subunit [Sulfitobacter sp. M57]|uniref:efflux RND transporter permease subunit n=1 Tax=unclassified Sulfitobacter TaxID=196795 RepID=UPI0023E1C1EE|nr:MULTISPECIES: efflux RND transporter permease subunit [unclassified Sulfitobacter]MDF3415545.1 efflux RND transporter permease subunit [Sulfitobacter sp. KE5]MDF3423026.1 efflux RND transporter permease subunit [Sulfitobacter sp. KE43]MDF3434091.1 efflux RND transporter permease subunit [Sulfitobacter sp. KE42]MDF3459876.1 efflux RND transporter permease subunit [Sulfitobacter sp. S74]MDF3463630.1 efflux RND transporter permease subunit [Sulfitobacter sp. Ks18]
MVRKMPSPAGGILSYFVRHRTAANLLLMVLLVAGFVSAPNMRAQFFPDVIVDNVTVSTVWLGAGAEDVDAGIVQILEPALLAIEGVEGSNSTSREGSGRIVLDFEPGWDMARAAADVQTAVDLVTSLPEEAEEPNVRRGAWRDRVTDVVITGPVATEQLGRFADEFVTRLFAAGVTRTTIQGVAAPQTLIEVPSVQLVAYDITMAEIAAAIAAEVDADPAGDVGGANARVRTGTAKRSAREIAGIVLRSNSDGSKLTIGDVATVRAEGVDRERQFFVGQNPAMSVRVDRSDRGDAIGIQEDVERVATELRANLPAAVTVELIRTRSEAIKGRLDLLIDNGLMGLGLVVGLLFLFLNARTAFWVAAGIPVAMGAAIALMYLGGLTINMISLFGLIITLGIVVDDAIVVGEHTDHRYRALGEPPMVAAEKAAQRMSMPVFAATLTTIIAFFGLVAVGGRFGDLIRDIPYTVIAVLAASLVECFLILPNHMAHAVAAADKAHWYDTPSRVVNRGFVWLRETLFRPFMAGVIRARYVVLAGVVAVLASQLAMFIKGDVQWRFFNAPERGSVTGNFMMTEGATRADTLAMMREMQRATEVLGAEYGERYGVNPLDYVIAQTGGNSGYGLAGADTKDNDLLGGISIELIDADLRCPRTEGCYSSFAFVAELQDSVVNHPMAETVSFRGWRSGPGGDALDVQFYGADTERLKAASEALQEALRQYPEVSAVQDNLAYDKEELILDLTPQGQALGFTIDTLGRALRHRLGGIEAATYPDGPRSATIRVELPKGELTADFLDRTQMRTPAGLYVPLADIVSVQRRTGFSTVRRENGIRLISVTGDISEDDAARATAIQDALENDILPRIASELQVEYRLAGLSEQESDFLSDALTGLTLCLTGIYLVLAWVFGSWTRPMVVMAIIPFGLVGTIYGHHLWEVPLSMFTVVGLLGMTGIIINDSIVLVTTIDEYAETRGLIPSIIDGAADRLRPVMLTTLTTVLGMAPLLYEQSQQAQFLKPTVITLVYGLGFGMILVLLVVPALIAAQHDVARQIAALRRGMRAPLKGLRLGMLGLWTVVLGWGAVTMGWAAWFGALHPLAASVVPAMQALPALLAGLLLFVAGAALVALVGYLMMALVFNMRRKV